MKKQFILYAMPAFESYGSSIKYVKEFAFNKPVYTSLRGDALRLPFFSAYRFAFRHGLSVLPAKLA